MSTVTNETAEHRAAAGTLTAGHRLWTGGQWEQITHEPYTLDGVVHVPTMRDGQARTRTFSPDEQVRIDPARQARLALEAGSSTAAVAMLLGVTQSEARELYLDDMAREHGWTEGIGRRPKRPFWLTEDCPAWCQTGHDDADHPEDRTHMLNADEPVLLLSREHAEDGRPVDLRIGLQQHYDQVAPTVAPYLMGKPALFRLTLAEARQLAAMLSAVADMAEQDVRTTCKHGTGLRLCDVCDLDEQWSTDREATGPRRPAVPVEGPAAAGR